MRCVNPITVNGRQYNCGKCMPCRINRTSEWTLRLMYELSCHYEDGASFITLTYDDEHLPKDNGLHKEELQRFWKRLRTNLRREYHEFAPKLRYYACGEYGTEEETYFSPGAEKPHGRPHFHAIVFGLNNFCDKHRELLVKSWPFCEAWMFDKSRGKDSGMQEVTVDDIRYVCGYVQKKLNGDYAKEKYGEALPPFNNSSQSLGLDFAMKNQKRLLDNGYTFLKGQRVGIPRYFCNKFGVLKSQLLQDKPKDIAFLMANQETLMKKFKEDMQRAGTWYPDNEQMMKYRLEKWFENRQFEYAKAIEAEYRQKAKLRGAKL